MKDFNNSDIRWRDNPTGHKQIRFLGYIDDNCLRQMVKEPVRENILLNFIFTNKEALIRDEKAGSRLGCSYHKMVFTILREGSKANSRISVLGVMTADFSLFKDLFGRIPRDMVLEKLGVEDSWMIFMDQEQFILMRRISIKDRKMTRWVNKQTSRF
ncbi:hypothetical protein AV530_016958 [Patagioenas fasciata monilis]|uniref:Uncharacterized protein n=1 Tax=Patagioenas fasciata monilis TaxID=372326 RepID=A0A1V4J463_PATFA|nr:hypothetical protein AV530_016958 [Patagioenas fasciata monilis]